MTKRLFFILTLSLVSLFCSAQIQRKILDFTLGVTTKTQVLNYLKNNHYKYSLNEDGDYIVEKVRFAGHNWPVAFFCFYKGKFYCVDFRDANSFTPRETLDLVWERLGNSLKKKYIIYSTSSNSDYLDFSDNKTNISLSYKYLFGEQSLSLIYYDYNLFGQKHKEEENEL